jgi:hypothetical protein
LDNAALEDPGVPRIHVQQDEYSDDDLSSSYGNLPENHEDPGRRVRYASLF